MTLETLLSSMIWPSTIVSVWRFSKPRFRSCKDAPFFPSSTALTELEPMSRPTRFFLPEPFLNMLVGPHHSSALFVLLTKAGTGLSRAGQLSFDELRSSGGVRLDHGHGSFVGKVVDQSVHVNRNVPAGGNRELLESGTAGMKLIGNPAKLVTTNFRRLCDLRSREVCLSRAPSISRDCPLVEIQVGTRSTADDAVNLSESTLMGQTMSTAILHRLTYCVAETKVRKRACLGCVSGTNGRRFQFQFQS